MSHLQQIATRPDLAMTSSNRRTIDKIRTEITDHVCDKGTVVMMMMMMMILVMCLPYRNITISRNLKNAEKNGDF